MGVPVELFVDQEAIRTLKCALCQEVMQEAVRTPCGHSFCQHCISRALSNGGKATAGQGPGQGHSSCPVCQKALQPDGGGSADERGEEGGGTGGQATSNSGDRQPFTEDREAREAIAKLSTRCQHSGCPWVGELQSHMKHINEECAFVNVRCPNYPCSAVIPRRLMPQHLTLCDYKPIVCQHCKSPVPVVEQQVRSFRFFSPLLPLAEVDGFHGWELFFFFYW